MTAGDGSRTFVYDGLSKVAAESSTVRRNKISGLSTGSVRGPNCRAEFTVWWGDLVAALTIDANTHPFLERWESLKFGRSLRQEGGCLLKFNFEK